MRLVDADEMITVLSNIGADTDRDLVTFKKIVDSVPTIDAVSRDTYNQTMNVKNIRIMELEHELETRKQQISDMRSAMRIDDEVFIHGFIDEIRGDTIIIRNEGGYFGTAKREVYKPAQSVCDAWEMKQKSRAFYGEEE